MAKKKPARKRRSPLIISIHGDGIDIDASISDVGTPSIDALVQAFSKSASAPPEESNVHDFDVVQRVIKHGKLEVLQAIVELAKAELESRSPEN